jgi:hypothetical protein
VIHPDLPRFDNSGYVVTLGDSTIYHPGDALTPPGEPVDLLCVVVSAPWMRAAEAVDFARLVGAPATSPSTTGSTPRPASASSTATSPACSPTPSPTSGSPTAPTSS